MRKHVLTSLLSLAFAAGAAGQFDRPPGLSGGPPGSGMPMSGHSLVQVEAIAPTDAVYPDATFYLSFTFHIEPGWHIYWINPGDTGSLTDIAVEGPEGFTIGSALYPRPEVIEAELLTYGYEKTVTLFVPVTAPAELDEGEATFTASINWLVCREQCFMGDAERTLTVRTTSTAPSREPTAADAGRIMPVRGKELTSMFRRVPVTLMFDQRKAESRYEPTWSFDGEKIVFSASAQDFTRASWLPIPSPGVKYGGPTFFIKDNRVTMILPVTINERAALGRPMRLEGVVALGERPDDPSYHFKRPVDATNPTN